LQTSVCIGLRGAGQVYKVNPEKDLVPVFPNCHAMTHSTKPFLTIKKLQDLMQDSKD
jgi:5-methylcytosine-specific restriction protein A